MERKKSSLVEHLPSARLRLSDLRKILDVLNEVGTKVTIDSASHTYLSIEEFIQHEERILTDVKLRCRSPYLSVSFEPNQICLYAEDRTAELRGAYEKIREIVLSRRSRTLEVWQNTFVSGIFLGSSAWLLVFSIKNGSYWYLLAFVLWLAFGLTWVFCGFRSRFKGYAKVILEEGGSLGFFEKNRDQIILVAISAFFGGVITLVVSALIGDK